MRMCMRVQIPVEAGNKTIADGSMQQSLEPFFERLRPEAAYFLPQDGVRSMLVFFDLKQNADLPAITELLFDQFHAKVDITPAMDLEDLRSGLRQAQEQR